MNYENHLHVIFDESIDIYSFNQDYFLDQDDKSIGIQFRNEKSKRTLRGSYFEDTDESLYDGTDDLPF
ncbi:hypothetical protein LXD69_00205 [Flavobacterium sediminilitoris]|uniref:Uncharacterized protein n=1 Tax=Flavobacterium sediminilitoris TaxID=2024526 RepID=A0ABY4HMZ7_9FLAO|nr:MULTISPECIES: hypothetical protein [Flavobacterium]UOX33953.1 hypothetical protein LXD69_00205 [Flavobacterium sediminilitoris]